MVFFLFIYLFMAVLGLCFCARAFSSCGKRGPLFIAVRGPLTIAASLVAEHRLQTRRLSNYGSWAQLLRGMWDLPRPGLEPVSPALAGRFSTTAPPGKPSSNVFDSFTCSFKKRWVTFITVPPAGKSQILNPVVSRICSAHLWFGSYFRFSSKAEWERVYCIHGIKYFFKPSISRT